MWRGYAVVLALVLLCGCQSNEATRLSPEAFAKRFSSEPSTNKVDEAAARPGVIAAGMQISVTVDEDRSLNRQYVVPPSGILEFPGAGRINIAGLTAEELTKKIKTPLEKDYFQKATVTVTIDAVPTVAGRAAVGGGGGVVYVLGAINKPGPLMLPQNEVFTITKVIIAAGGFNSFAKGSKVRLVRYDTNGKRYETFVNVGRIMKEGELEKDVAVQGGDWIIVPEKLFSF